MPLGEGNKKIIYSVHLSNLSPNDFSQASETTPYFQLSLKFTEDYLYLGIEMILELALPMEPIITLKTQGLSQSSNQTAE